MMMRQIIAILVDSLRFLRSQWLFWVALGFSFVIALLLFGTIYFSENSWRVLWLAENESDTLHEGSDAAKALMSWLFGGAFVYWWLSWGAIIVALISTASIVPNLVSSGSIDLLSSKPIRRSALFLTKISGALLFMLVQVTLGVLAAYVLLGVLYGMWFHGALWAIPLLTLQFLYLFSVMALSGLYTKSPLASLLVVFVFWAIVSIFQFVGGQIDSHVAQIEAMAVRYEQRIESVTDSAAAFDRELTSLEQRRIERWKSDIESQRDTIEMLQPWQNRVNRALLVVPKTGDVQKIIADQVDSPTFGELILILQGWDAEAVASMTGMDDPQKAMDMHEAGVAGARAIRDVETWRSIGSSLVFTAVILLIATIIFMRRDF